MKTQGSVKRGHFGFSVIAATLLYVVLAVRPLHQSLRLEPEAPLLLPEENYSSQTMAKNRKGDIRAFSNLDTLGYYTDSGELTFVAPTGQAAAIDKSHILKMDSESGAMLLIDSADMSERKLPIFGSPYIAGGRLFILRPDQRAATEIDGEGKHLWSREFGTPVTSISVTDTISAWGLMDGSVKLVGKDGSLAGELRPENYAIGSAYPCIYSVAISPDGASVAAVYGIESQYFLVFVKKGGVYELTYKKPLAQPVRSSEDAAFSGDASCAVARTAEGLIFYDARKKEGKILRNRYFSGSDVSLKILPMGADSFAILLARGQGRFAGLLKRGAVEALFPVRPDTAGMDYYDNTLALAGGRSIERYRMVGK